MKTSKETDWVGSWYAVAKERGVNDVFQLARVNTETNEIKIENFEHSKFDGAGALAVMLRKDGHEIKGLPQQRPIEKLSIFQIIAIMLRCIKDHGNSKIKWKNCDYNRTYAAQTEEPPFSWIIFSREESKQINRLAKESGVSQNSFLLGEICQTVLPELLEEDALGDWLFPVNMRGIVKKEDPLSNHTSGITITTDCRSRSASIHSQIKNKLEAKRHLGNWWLLHIGKIIGLRGMRYLSKNSSKKCFRLGTFTCLGSWPIGEKTKTGVDYQKINEVIIAAPPGTPNHPIGIATIFWDGQLALTIKLHSSISSDAGLAKKLAQKLKENILKKVITK